MLSNRAVKGVIDKLIIKVNYLQNENESYLLLLIFNDTRVKNGICFIFRRAILFKCLYFVNY